MSKYKILWIDDKWDEMDSFKEVCELPENGMEITPCKYSTEGMELFEKRIEEWSGVILDAKVLYNKDEKLDRLKGLTYSIKRINKLSSIREVPYYIFTGQPDTASGSSFAEEHEGRYYEKALDEDRLIADIKKNAECLIETQIIHKHQKVFETWPEIRHDLIRILKVLENEDWRNNSVLTDIRKVLSNVFYRCYERGFCSVEHNGSNLAECSIDMGQPFLSDSELVPEYIQRALQTCVRITNAGSHRTQTDKDVSNGNAPYLIRSLIYEMLNILYWCRILPPKEDCDQTRRALCAAKAEYSYKKLDNQKSNSSNE
jgi:hypothetical protein